jgi:peptide/nickel transport system ATP-binding protein
MRRTMQLVFQDPYSALDPSMTIGQSMIAPLMQHALHMPGDCKAKVLDMLREVGLTDAFYDRYPHQCSGGQLQRVGIGRALLLRPEFLVCDEPTSALDSSMRTQILNLLSELRIRLRLTILMITHDLRLVSRFCDRIAVMYLGQIVEIAPAADLFANPQHPYTRALISSSLLDEHGLEETIDTLQGEPPSPLNPPSGCRLRTRCAHADNRCAQAEPMLRSIVEDEGTRHFVRCHHFERIAAPRGAQNANAPAMEAG